MEQLQRIDLGRMVRLRVTTGTAHQQGNDSGDLFAADCVRLFSRFADELPVVPHGSQNMMIVVGLSVISGGLRR